MVDRRRYNYFFHDGRDYVGHEANKCLFTTECTPKEARHSSWRAGKSSAISTPFT